MQTIKVPELYCPFRPTISEHADAVGRHTVDWALGHGLLSDPASVDRFVAGRYGTLAARNHTDVELDLLAVVCAGYFDAFLWEADNRAAQRTPDSLVYAKMRLHTGAVDTSFIVGTLADRLDLPPDVFGHPAVIALREAANNIVCWQHDLLSLSKELDIGEVHNLVVVTRRANGGSLQDAADVVATMHDEEMRRFVSLSDEVLTFGGRTQRDLVA